MLSDSINSELLLEEKTSHARKLVAAALALVLTTGLLAGYLYFRNRYAKENMVTPEQIKSSNANVPKGPPRAHILVDEARNRSTEPARMSPLMQRLKGEWKALPRPSG